ncbi:MAG TPA: MgtC/SapB family protein [Planctomycetaceae bacterium]|nr:MgtC/SapB family protein [Planctomycetaceae bacterium]
MHGLAFITHMATALALGTAIGLERQLRQHPAGLRTNALVSLGAALFVSLSQLIDQEGDRTRIAAQVVSGIGFLAGGVILREGFSVRGMNTAATMWCTAAIGSLAGGGFLLESTIGAGFVLLLHLTMRPIVNRIEEGRKSAGDVETHYRVQVVCPADQAAVVRTILMRHVNAQQHMTVQGLSTRDADQPGISCIAAEVFSTERNDRAMNDLVSRVGIEPNVTGISWEKLH